MIDQGYFLSVWDGKEFVTSRLSGSKDVIAAMMQTDEDFLCVYDGKGKRVGFVCFVYGNDGWDVIYDYSTALKTALEPVFVLANKLEKQYG